MPFPVMSMPQTLVFRSAWSSQPVCDGAISPSDGMDRTLRVARIAEPLATRTMLLPYGVRGIYSDPDLPSLHPIAPDCSRRFPTSTSWASVAPGRTGDQAHESRDPYRCRMDQPERAR